MSKEADNNLEGKTSKIFETIFIGDKKVIERYSIIALFSLIVSIIFISFDLRLIAGCFIIIACSTGIIVVKKAFHLLNKIGESFEEASTSSEKKDDVITDFSHRIREPLNNLVIIGDLLIGSGLQKKQERTS